MWEYTVNVIRMLQLLILFSQTTLQMPQEIQERISHCIGTTIQDEVVPPLQSVEGKMDILVTA